MYEKISARMNANSPDNSSYLLTSHDMAKERAHLTAGSDRNARKMRVLRQFQSEPGHSAEAWTLTDHFVMLLRTLEGHRLQI